MTGLLIAGISIVGVFVYATIGVAVDEVARGVLERRCCAKRGRDGPVNHISHEHDGTEWFIAAAWAAVLPVMALTWLAFQAARGPAAWGTWLAEIGTRRSTRKVALQDRIRELEGELGMGES